MMWEDAQGERSRWYGYMSKDIGRRRYDHRLMLCCLRNLARALRHPNVLDSRGYEMARGDRSDK
jgi:hypothetical protein